MGKIILILIILVVFAGVYIYSTMQKPAVCGKVLLPTRPLNKLSHIDEGFQAPDGVLEEAIGSSVTYPNGQNPFMNVLLDEIKYNPTRGEAASVFDPAVTVTLDSFFQTQFVNDPTDVFGKTQSQRQFYTMPSTTVPNDQESYQNWLYKIPGKTCKEGGREACSASSGSAGAALPWLSEN